MTRGGERRTCACRDHLIFFEGARRRDVELAARRRLEHVVPVGVLAVAESREAPVDVGVVMRLVVARAVDVLDENWQRIAVQGPSDGGVELRRREHVEVNQVVAQYCEDRVDVLVRIPDRVARDDRVPEDAHLHEIRDVRERDAPPVRTDAVELHTHVRGQIPAVAGFVRSTQTPNARARTHSLSPLFVRTRTASSIDSSRTWHSRFALSGMCG